MESVLTDSSIHEILKDKENIGLIEKISYGFGDLGSNFVMAAMSNFLLFFYTNVALIPVEAVALLLLISKGVDAFADPIIGGMIDKTTNSKRGKTHPYMLFGAIPFAILFILTFTVFDFSPSGKIVYAYITYILLGILYSVVNVPYGCLMPMMSRSPEMRISLVSFRMLGSCFGALIISSCMIYLVDLFGNGDKQMGFTLTTGLFGILAMLSFWIVVAKCRERYSSTNKEEDKEPKIEMGFIEKYKTIFKNVPWIISVIVALCHQTKGAALGAVTLYYCMYVMNSPWLAAILLSLIYIGRFVSAISVPFLVKKLKLKWTNLLGLGGFLVGFSILIFVKDPVIFCIVYVVAQCFDGLNTAAVYGMAADSVDYHEWRFGIKAEGTIYGGYSFANKIGLAFGAAIMGYILSFAGYDPSNITEYTKNIINLSYFCVPIVFTIIPIVALFFYKLDAIHPQIVKELAEK
ncbi:MAG: glycoside-pentoside-hexuronide (GPH):cation symporter [Selenomonadaceae bacterium]